MRTVGPNRRPNLLNLWENLDRQFDDLIGSDVGRGLRQPPVNAWETDKSYILEAELPGYNESSVTIKVENDLLIIESSGENQAAQESAQQWLIRERPSLGFRRSFALPKQIKVEKIEAVFSNGILTLTIPKHEQAQSRTIAIKRA